MASIFPYVAVWGFFNGFLLPRSFALKNSRWLAFLSPTYHFACSHAKASNGCVVRLDGHGDFLAGTSSFPAPTARPLVFTFPSSPRSSSSV